MPLYYFVPEGPSWSNYQDEDGIELPNDAEALAYANSMILELKQEFEGIDHVKNSARETIFRIAIR